MRDTRCRISELDTFRPAFCILNPVSKFTKTLAIFALALMAIGAKSQVYPVQGSATLIPPYALRLSDYTTSVNERFVVNTILADVTKAELHVRFRISIVSQNIKLETKPEYIGTPISLQGGIPLRLTNIELAEYFDPNHLNFSGISKADFLKTGSLPEGFYQFCFEVYEYNRGVKISNTICAPAWLVLNDPPLINTPFSGTKLKPLSPQNVIMQWTPRHTGSPNAAFTTEYDVKVVEVWPANRNPNDAILTQPAIFETTTNSTTFVYGPDATQLEPGRVYAFRVQARAMTGAEHLDLFKNNGYSETVTFIYGDACDAPVNVVAEAQSPTRISLQWDASPSQTGYTVQYRIKGKTDGNWYSSSSLIPSLEISSLQPNTAYEYQLMSTCGPFESNFGNIASITTPDMAQKGYSCGMPLENFNLDPSQLIPTLKVGDVINAGDFDVTIAKVTGANGLFSGAGEVLVPFLNQVKGRVTFDNITVNNDKRMVKGYMNVTGGGIDIVPSGVLAMMDQLTQSLSAADSILSLARQYFAPPPDPSAFVPDQVITVPAGIKTVIKDPTSGNIIVVDNNGQSQTIPPGKNTAITDGKGNGVIVGKNGGKADVSGPQLASIVKREYNLSVTFAKAANTNYGLDEQRLHPLKTNYEKLGDNYYVSWKAASTSSDPIVATYNGKDNIADKIKFEMDGVPASVTASGNAFTINVGLSATQTPSSIVAKVANGDKEQILGKLNVIGYDAKSVNLKIVKVNNAKFSVDAPTLKSQLDKIYSQAVVSWNVEVISQTLQVTGLADPFDDGNSGLLSNYTGDMKNVINTYGDLQPDTYYLFLIDKPASGNKLGYMPRAKKAGFIFTEPNGTNDQILNTMAHELGHGTFTLKHTFSDYTSLVQGSTDNLMDYNNGTNLWKYQWDRIHDPAVVLGLFEGDDAGASVKTPAQKAEGDILIKLSNFVEPLAVGKTNLKVTIEIPDIKKLKADNPDKSFKASLMIFDTNKERVYKTEISNLEKFEFEWDGTYAETPDKKASYKFGPYKLVVIAEGGTESTWTKFVECMSNLGDCISGNLNLTIQGKVEYEFSIDANWETWQAFAFKGDSKFEDFEKDANIFKDKFKSLGISVEPLEYLNESLQKFEFLGEQIIVHKNFAAILKRVKEKFDEGRYNELSAILHVDSDLRIGSDIDGRLSNHQDGLAIDINATSNPMIRAKYQPELFQYIYLVTGFNMNGKGLSLEDNIEAQRLFKSRVLDNNYTIEKLRDAFVAVENYENDQSKLSISSLPTGKLEKLVQENLGGINELTNGESGVSALLDKAKLLVDLIDDAIKIIPSYDISLCLNDYSPDEHKFLTDYLKSKYDNAVVIKDLLVAINSTNFNTSYPVLVDSYKKMLESQDMSPITALSKSISTSESRIGQLSGFGKKLYDQVKNAGPVLGGNLLKNGFFNLPEDFVAAMEGESSLRWGGGLGYYSLKDWMHFEIQPSKESEILK